MASAAPFYDQVNDILKSDKFDEFAEKECVGFLQERNDGPAERRAGSVFPDVDGWIFRRHRLRAWDRMAMRRFAESEESLGIRTNGNQSGSMQSLMSP